MILMIIMARPLRIEYPDAWYHVMNRGRRGENIFSDEHDYTMFTDLLRETSEIWKVRIAAYCLMPTHYHILLQTPDANISRSMRHLNKEKYGTGTINKEIPSSRGLLPDTKRIIYEVCSFYGVEDTEISEERRGRRNEARNAAIYLTRKL